MRITLIAVKVSIILIIFTSASFAQNKLSVTYRQRADSMYRNVWNKYRVYSEKGLFSENYPSGKNDSLNYFQGEAVKEKKVSFLWPFSGMWSATNVLMRTTAYKSKFKPFLDSLITGVEQYKDASRKPVGYQAYPVKFEKADRYYDDNGLVGIDYMESYFNTHNPLYLQHAKVVFNFIKSGWNDDAGGGVTWLEGHLDQKPACSNGMATLTALKIYQGSHDKFYLEQGKRFYNWMYSHLLDNATGIIINDVKRNGDRNPTFYSYNTGSLIEAAVLLYKFTGDRQYLLQAQQLAEASYQYFKNVKHDQRLTLSIDLPWFITVLFRGYEALYKIDGNKKYINAIEHDLNFAWNNSKDKSGLITHSWLPDQKELRKYKWLLDEACIAELYARLSLLN